MPIIISIHFWVTVQNNRYSVTAHVSDNQFMPHHAAWIEGVIFGTIRCRSVSTPATASCLVGAAEWRPPDKCSGVNKPRIRKASTTWCARYIHADQQELIPVVNDVIRGAVGRPCATEAVTNWSLHSMYKRLRGWMSWR